MRSLLAVLCIPPLVFFGLQLRSVRLEESAVKVIEAGPPSSADVDRADRLLKRAADYNPTSEPEFRRAQLYTFAGRPVDAQRLLEDIVRDEPEHLPAWILLARAADKTGDTELAEAARDRAQELNPKAGRLGQ